MSRLRLLLALGVCFVSTLSSAATPITIKILGINDFHGQITSGRIENKRPVGGAVAMAAWLKRAEKGMEQNTIIALMGDSKGASVPASTLLKHKPTMLFFNRLANSYCSAKYRLNPRCNLVATIGNHEFDDGQQALMAWIKGNTQSNYPGATFPFVSANIIKAQTGKTLFPPYVIKEVNGVKIAFIGAILKDAPQVIMPKQIKGLRFLDEAEAINHYIPEMKAKGADVIVAILHQGAHNVAVYDGATKKHTEVSGPLVAVVNHLDDGVDLVMGGHTHQFLNAYITNKHGKKVLVTQAKSYSSAFADITLKINPDTHKIISESARIQTTWADKKAGLRPDPEIRKLVAHAEDTVAPRVTKAIAWLDNDITTKPDPKGQSRLGRLIADAFKQAMKADIGMTQPGGIRANLHAGPVTLGGIYSVLPFANRVVKVSMTGAQIRQLLEQQWATTPPVILQTSGLSYRYNPDKPQGRRVYAVYVGRQALLDARRYTVATCDFLALGGDGFSAMNSARLLQTGAVDDEIVLNYIKHLHPRHHHLRK